MVSRSSGTFSPNPSQGLQTGISHSPHPSQAGVLSAGASPSTSSPTGTSSLAKIAVAQVFLLLSTIKEKKDDPTDYESKINRLNKLIDDNGMEVFTRYLARLVWSNATEIFPGMNRPIGSAANGGNYGILAAEMRKISHEIDQATKISEAIETGTEDIFRDFDLSTFMEHFRLDALEKTILALAFKLGSRSDLKTKADAILSTNFPTFITIVSKPDGDHADLSPEFLSLIIDRFIQYHPPSFNAASRNELSYKVESRYSAVDMAPPSEVLAALDLMRVLGDRPPNALAQYIRRVGPDFTRDEDACTNHLQNRPSGIQLSEEQVSRALTYTTISQNPQHNPAILVTGLRRVLPATFKWQDVLSYFDQRGVRISSSQFLRLYNAILPVAQEDDGSNLDIQLLWGGNWENPETQLSFICAFASLTPDALDASTVPGLKPTFTLDTYAQSPATVRDRAAYAVKHPLVSVAAMSAVFHVALHSVHASQTVEAKRLFQEVVVPNLDIFVVSAFGVPEPWPDMAVETLGSLFENFLYKRSNDYDFVLDSLWRRNKSWVKQRLVDAHALKPIDLPLIFEHAVKYGWLDVLVYEINGFGLDLAAWAHGEGRLDLEQWARNNASRGPEVANGLLRFLNVKTRMELNFQRPPDGNAPVKLSTTLQIKTVSHLLAILPEFLPAIPIPEVTGIQRQCITAYPRLINYGEGYDDIIDANGADGNALPLAANSKMEEHYKKMYGDEVQVKDVVDILQHYKHSRDPLEQDIFACMIHGLFDEYTHYSDYPLEALATTAVLFGGIISHKLIDGTPLQIGLGMILEAVRDHRPDDSMYKFGLQALMQLFGRLREWPGFCLQLLQIPGLQGTEAWKTAEDIVRDHQEEEARARGGHGEPAHGANGPDSLTNGNANDTPVSEQRFTPFTSVNVDPPPTSVAYEDPADETRDKVQFALNNIDKSSLDSRFQTIRGALEQKHQQWFASHLVEARAKMQPNLQQMYFELVNLFNDKKLWAEVLRETYVSVARMLNSEATMQNSTERTHLKNLGGWLGMLTLARDKPIRHKNIAFKQLLIEAHDTKRLIVVIPFVCKVLIQGASSNVFRPPNPWLMDIIYLLIELYHNAELKLNLKFEIEVLCKGLSLDHKSIEPSGEILNRVQIEEPVQIPGADGLEPSFDNLSINGIGQAVVGGLMPHAVAPSIPELGPNLSIPPTNEMVVSPVRLHEIVRTALSRALQEILQPVVERSVTIASLSTLQMIRKDFATEPDENRVRTSAINMVKATAGSLAFVTSKEPLRANFTNYMRGLSNDLPQGLPEGTILMCVNSNLDLASNIIEKAAEERAVIDIEDSLEPDLEARRRHRLSRPNEPFIDSSLSRWAWTIPNPFKLSPSLTGLNPEQMAIYEDFPRLPRANAATSTPSHVASTSDATRSMANEVLQDQYSSVPSVPTPAETPSMAHMAGQIQNFSHAHAGLANGRQPGVGQFELGNRTFTERVTKLLMELQKVTREAPDDHYKDLPRPHPVLDTMDALNQTIIKAHQQSETFTTWAVEQLCSCLLNPSVTGDNTLAIESFAHALAYFRRIGGSSLNQFVRSVFAQEDGQRLLRLPLIISLVETDLIDWRIIDKALAKFIDERQGDGVALLDGLLQTVVLNDTPTALMADLSLSLEVATTWMSANADHPASQALKATLETAWQQPSPARSQEDAAHFQHEQMDYVFDEWVRRCQVMRGEVFANDYVDQLRRRNVVSSKDHLFVFVRLGLDRAVAHYEQAVNSGASINDAYLLVDALTTLIMTFVKTAPIDGDDDGSGSSSRGSLLEAVWSVGIMLLNYSHAQRQEMFNQRVFFRFYSNLLNEAVAMIEADGQSDRKRILLSFASTLSILRPQNYPGFLYGWIALLDHPAFLPQLMKLDGGAGWDGLTELLKLLLAWLGEQLKLVEVTMAAKQIYEGTFKFLIMLQHDYPDYLAATAEQLIQAIPPHCKQLINVFLVAITDGSKDSAEGPAGFLRQVGLLDVLNQALQNGPSEDAVAHMTHAINRVDGSKTGFAQVPFNANVDVIDAITRYIGGYAAQRHEPQGGPVLESGTPEMATLSMLVHELLPEPRYFLLVSIVNQLRHSNPYTDFFREVVLDMFSRDMTDPEELEIREHVTRVLLERLVGYWPQPWGLTATITDLVKNEKYMFLELPFIKQSPDVARQFLEAVPRA